MRITEIPGLGPKTEEKLAKFGITDVYQFMSHSPQEIRDMTGIDADTAVNYFAKARQALLDNQAIDKIKQTGNDIKKKRTNLKRITFACKPLDDLFLGGIETQALTEIYGEFGCLTENSRIVLGDGTITDIKHMGSYNEELINNNVMIESNNYGYKYFRTTRFFKYDNASIIEIITNSGKSIKGTPNHPLLLESGDWRELKDLKIGDNLQTIKNIPCSITSYIDTNFKIKNNNYGPKYKGLIPKVLDEDLASFIGYLIGDGWITSDGYQVGLIIAHDEFDIKDKLIEIAKNKFNVVPNIYYRTGSPSIYKGRKIMSKETNMILIFSSQQINQMLSIAASKKIPDLILKSKNSVVSSFLKWLFTADGSIVSNGRAKRLITLSSSNIELLRDVQILLLRFGIYSTVQGSMKGRTSSQLMIRRIEDIIKFADNIGIETIKKINKLNQLIKDVKNSNRTCGNRKKQSESLETIVKIINLDEKQTVYDIEVPTYHKFIANGIISHNSNKTQICHHMAVRAQLLEKDGGLSTEDKDAKIVWIDTEHTFRPERIEPIALRFGLDPEKVLDNIIVFNVRNSVEQQMQLEETEQLIREENVKLIIVDSLMGLFRNEYLERGNLSVRQSRVNKFVGLAARFADVYNISVLVTNQVSSNPDGFHHEVQAIGGNVVAHTSTYRIFLKKSGGNRIARMIDSPHHPDGEVMFKITTNGIMSIEEAEEFEKEQKKEQAKLKSAETRAKNKKKELIEDFTEEEPKI